MKNTLFKKGVVVGIIILFIGLAFIPSFNAISISKDIEVTNLVVDDVEKDCLECQSNGKTHLAEKLLTRLEKNEILSNVIYFDNQYDRPICELLLKWGLYYNDLGWYYLYSGHYFMGKIYLGISLYIYETGALLLCWPFVP